MGDPKLALTHASNMAADIVVIDHSPGSERVFHAAEKQKVRRSSDAMKHFGIRRWQSFQLEQRFADYSEVLTKVSTQGPTAVQRAGRHFGAMNIIIPMHCELVLL